MKTLFVLIFLFISISFFGCKKAEPEPIYEHDEFYSKECVFMEGGTNVGNCGWHISALRDNGNFVFLKPNGMIANANYTYEARIEVLAATFECYDGMGDLIPGRKREKLVRQYANILEFKRIR